MVERAEGVVATGNDEYLYKLTFSRATPAATGVYVCLAVNNFGFSFKKAHLTVLRKPGIGSLIFPSFFLLISSVEVNDDNI